MSSRSLTARSSSSLAALPLLALAASAALAQSQTYTVEVRPALNDLDVKIEQVAQASTLVIKLTNNSPTRVRCNVRFDASPQTPVRRSHNIDPGRTESSVLRAQRRWFSVAVDVECVPATR